MFYSNSIAHGPTLAKDLSLIDSMKRFVESWRRFLRAGQVKNPKPREPEVRPNGEGAYCPLPPFRNFPWEQNGPGAPRRLSFVSGALAVRPHLRQARCTVLAVMMALVLGVAGIARAQQEVAPDHYEELPQYTPARMVAHNRSRVTRVAGHRSRLTARAHRPGQGPDRNQGLHSKSKSS
jgi:hypothetical protein